MRKFWHSEKNAMDFADWEYPTEDVKQRHTEGKKIIIAVLLLGFVYGLQQSGTLVGEFTKQGVQRLVTEQSNFSNLTQKLQNYLPQDWRSGFWEKVQGVLAKPADPSRYRQVPIGRED